MKRRSEKNIAVFNQDVKDQGSYEYTTSQVFSAYTANKRQSKEIIKLLKKQNKKDYTILDVGSGDGTYTYEYYKEIKPKKIVGFDSAVIAVKAAKKKCSLKDLKRIEFKVCNIYDIDKKFAKNSFDIIIIRGVLHHLYDPQKAIKAACKVSKKIIVLEPNGYNPILKVIEKTSKYHIKHEEKSYWPPTLNKWFIDQGFKVKEQSFCVIVPYFCPEIMAKMLKIIEPIMEKIPVIQKFYCGTNVIYYER